MSRSEPDRPRGAPRAGATPACGQPNKARPSGVCAPAHERIPTKTSFGVILCRTNASTGRQEALLVHKRYTYAFAEFVHGRYFQGWAGSAVREAAPLLDRMTVEELLDVWSLNFEQMWYRIWLTQERRDLFNKKCARFQQAFMRDSGVALRRAVQQARSCGSLLWEVPKGRRLGAHEADALCAVRELREETGVGKSEYQILPGVRRRVSYVSAGTRYTCVYYVATTNSHYAGAGLNQPTLRDIRHMGEVNEIRWLDINQIRLLEGHETHLSALVAPAFRLAKRRHDKRRGIGPKTPALLAIPIAARPAAIPAARLAAVSPVSTAPVSTAPAAASPVATAPAAARLAAVSPSATAPAATRLAAVSPSATAPAATRLAAVSPSATAPAATRLAAVSPSATAPAATRLAAAATAPTATRLAVAATAPTATLLAVASPAASVTIAPAAIAPAAVISAAVIPAAIPFVSLPPRWAAPAYCHDEKTPDEDAGWVKVRRRRRSRRKNTARA